MDYDYITDQAVKLQQFQDGESVKKDETPAQKLRTAAWGLNTKCSKPNCVLPEKEKKKAHQISSVVISFCEDSKYRDAEDWEARAQKFRVMIQEKSEELDRIEKEILRTSLEISTLQEAERIEDLKETVLGRASRSQQQLEERLRASWRRLCGTWRVEGTHGKTHQGSAPPPEQSRLDAAIKANRPLGSRQRTGNRTSGRRRGPAWGAWALRFIRRSSGCGWTSWSGDCR